MIGLRTTTLAALAGLTAIGALTTAQAGAWYLSPTLGIIGADSARGQVDNGTFGSFAVGKHVSDNISVEARLFILSMNSEVASEKTNQKGVTFDALWFPFGSNATGKTFAPFLLAGVGAVSTEIGDDFDSSNSLINLGAGASIRLGDNGMALRGEARYRFDFVEMGNISSFNDWQAGLGLNIPLATDPFDNSNSPATPTVYNENAAPPETANAPQREQADIPATDFESPDEFESANNPPAQKPWPQPTTAQRKRPRPVDPKVETGASNGAMLARISDPDGADESSVIARDLAEFQPTTRNNDRRVDSDADGIADSRDSCPNSPRGAVIDGNGCAPIQDTVLSGVTFLAGSDEISQESKSALARVASLLRERPATRVEIAGHTDWRGSAANNLSLSQMRAEAVRDTLIAMGVNANQVQARGYGDSKPIADNSSKAGRARNRRVEMRVLQN